MTRIKTSNLAEHVSTALGRRIVSGEYAPAFTFQISDLCDEFKVSRTVMREAIKGLSAKGLVTSRASVGSIVSAERDWNLTDPDVLDWMLHIKGDRLPLIREFNAFRMGIEPEAARQAALTRDASHIAEIDAALERMRAAERGEDDSLEADIAFHLAILQASENRFFINMRHTIEVALQISIRVTNRKKAVAVASAADHALIADAIRVGDAEAASAAMCALIAEARRLLD